MRDIKIDLQKSCSWKFQLTIVINFISSNDVNEDRVMHSKSDNTELLTYDNVNYAADQLLIHFLWDKKLATNINEREQFCFRFSSTVIVHNKVNCKRVRSYIESPDWIKEMNVTINPKNDNNKC